MIQNLNSSIIFQNKVCSFRVRRNEATAAALIAGMVYFEILCENFFKAFQSLINYQVQIKLRTYLYVQGQNSKKEYIISPNPVSSTVDYFWCLIREMNVNVIVMLGELEEVSVCSKLEQFLFCFLVLIVSSPLGATSF